MSEAQDGALYAAMWGQAEQLFSQVTVEDFDPGPYQQLAAIIERGMLDGHVSDMASYAKDEALRLGRPAPSFVVEIATAGFTGTVDYYARKLRERSIHRQMEVAGTRFLQAIGKLPGPQMYDALDGLTSEIAALPQIELTEDDVYTLDDLMGMDVHTEPFTIPNLLRKNERLVLTGSEGGGKSVFIYQLLTGAAFGVDTFTGDRHEPKRVLFVDVENNPVQTRANLDKVVHLLRDTAPEVVPQWFWTKQRVINLLATADRASLIRRIAHYKPDILYMGTAYKLTETTDETHRSVRAIQSFVDRVREEVECSVLIEHHAGHGFQNDRNGMRPEGSSYWLRWPDAGKGMLPMKKDGHTKRFMVLKSWRGDRMADREWPVALVESGAYPWRPVYEPEYEEFYQPIYGPLN